MLITYAVSLYCIDPFHCTNMINLYTVMKVPSVYMSKTQTVVAFIRQVVEQPTCDDGSSFLLFCLAQDNSKTMFIFLHREL